MQPNQLNVQPKASNSPQKPTQVQPKDGPSDGETYPSKNGKARGKKTLANHPPSQMLNHNFSKRLTRGQAKEVDQVIQRLENLNLYSDELDGEPKGDLASFALVATANLEPSYFENSCTNDV